MSTPPSAPAGDADATTHWARRPERGSPALTRFMVWVALRLGRAPARLLLAGIAAYFLLFAPAARRASADYLGRVFKRAPRLAEQYRHIHAFASALLDRVFLLADRHDEFEFTVENEALLTGGDSTRPRGALLFGAHLGSFEATRSLGRRHALRVALAMYEDNARRIMATLNAINPAARPEVIPLGQLDAMLRVRDLLDAGGVVGVLADRDLAPRAAGADVVARDFLGAPADFPLGPWRMAALLGARVVFMAGLYEGGRRYRIRFVELADFAGVSRSGRAAAIDAGLAAYIAELERCCRAQPYNWFNFFPFWRPDPRA